MENSPMKMQVAGRLSGVGEYYFSKKLREIDQMRAAGKDIISLGVGGPDQPPHPKVIARLAAEAAKPNTHAYQPYKGTAILRNAFARWYGRFYGVTLDPESEILPLIGSKEGIMHVCMTYLNPGDKVLIPNPGYPTYRSAATIAGGVCVDYLLREENGWNPSIDELKELVRPDIVNFPHMPTGAAPREGLFRDLVAFARRNGILLLHDNPYSFIRNEHPESLLATVGAKDVALELNSLSKSHSMAGWRIGMLAGGDPVSRVLFAKHLLSASLMAAPGSIVLAKILCPQTEKVDDRLVKMEKVGQHSTVLDALAAGTSTGVRLMVNIAAMLLVFIAMVALANYILEGVIGRYTGLNDWIVSITDGKAQGLTFQFILGVILSPFMWLIGVPYQDVMLVGSLLGQKTILNEFVAYFQLQEWKDAGLFLYQKSILMSTYILCGFANISSIGILLGGMGVLAPEKRELITRFGFPAMIAGALVSVLSATIIGMMLIVN